MNERQNGLILGIGLGIGGLLLFLLGPRPIGLAPPVVARNGEWLIWKLLGYPLLIGLPLLSYVGEAGWVWGGLGALGGLVSLLYGRQTYGK